MVPETIEFCLWHEQDIKLALEAQTANPLRAISFGSTLAGSSGSRTKVSDPTSLQALRRIDALNYLDVPYGQLYGPAPKYNEKTKLYAADHRWQETFRLHYPGKWLRITVALKKYYLSEGNAIRDFFIRRYVDNEPWATTCKELAISRGKYFIMKAEVIHTGELFAVAYGAATVESMLR